MPQAFARARPTVMVAAVSRWIVAADVAIIVAGAVLLVLMISRKL